MNAAAGNRMNDKKRNIILFNPRAMRGVGEDSIPPIGLLMAAIRLHEKFNVVIIDQRVEKNWRVRRKQANSVPNVKLAN